jgi:glycosyltransferase involved in cell wall biosynthesis
MGERFIFGQGYENLADVEDQELRERAHTITVPLPHHVYEHSDSWIGDENRAILLCPGILQTGYYREVYAGIKRDFGDLPHAIFGRQPETVDDPAVLPYLSDSDLLKLYASAAVFIYPSDEPRHVHYSPVEAMVVGTPVLYRTGALIDTLAGSQLPGACSDTQEMRAKAQRLLDGDHALAEAIRTSQRAVVESFSIEVAAHQWADVLRPVGGIK